MGLRNMHNATMGSSSWCGLLLGAAWAAIAVAREESALGNWGTVGHVRSPRDPISFVECGGRVHSYSGAWLAHREFVLSVDHFPKVSADTQQARAVFVGACISLSHLGLDK